MQPEDPIYSEEALELLVRVTDNVAYPDWELDPEALVRIGDRSLTATIVDRTITPRDFVVTFEDATLQLFGSGGGAFGRIAPMFSASGVHSSWILEEGHSPGHERMGSDSRTSISFSALNETFRAAEIAVTVVIYCDAPRINFPHPLSSTSKLASRQLGDRGLRCRILGKEALIREVVIPQLGAYGRVIAVACAGPPLPDATRNALHTVTSFLLGGWMQPFMEIAHDRHGRVVARYTHVLSAPSERKHTPPIDLYRGDLVAALGSHFERLVARCQRLFSAKIYLTIAIGHLFERQSGTDREIRDITLALSSLVESDYFDPQIGRTLSKSRFKTLRCAILQHLTSLATSDEAKFVKRVGDVLPLALSGSTTARRELFWATVGFDLTDEELEALEYRDIMSHRGHIMFDTSVDAEWQTIAHAKNLLRTLLNRVILSLLQYRGEAKNYLTGRSVDVSPSVDDLATEFARQRS